MRLQLYRLVNRCAQSPRKRKRSLSVVGIFVAKKFAVGKLAARNFRRTRPEQTPFNGI